MTEDLPERLLEVSGARSSWHGVGGLVLSGSLSESCFPRSQASTSGMHRASYQ